MGWADLGGNPNPYLHPGGNTVLIAKYKMHTVNDTTLIGQTRAIFDRGWHPTSDSINFGDSLGNQYPNISQTFIPVTFCACVDSDRVGSGTGVLGNQQNHIDTKCFSNQSFLLSDITRRSSYNPHGHNGQMGSLSEIVTKKYVSTLPGNTMFDKDTIWNYQSQRSGVDAHAYAGLVYDYMLSHLNRNGFDTIGGIMGSTVEYPGMHNFSGFDVDNHIVIYGTATSPNLPASGEVDVVAHEWAHGITHFESKLDSTGQSRSLDESFSDMFGVAVGMATNDADWLVGEHVLSVDFRNLMDPHSSNPQQPDTYHGQYWDTTNTLQARYTNAGVPNKMFYLLSVGGTHNGIPVQGIGIENAMKIMYYSNRYRWDSTTAFCPAKISSVAMAKDLDFTGNWAVQTAAAWNAVGVCPYVVGDANCNGECRGSDITYLTGFFKGTAQVPPDCICTSPNYTAFWMSADYNGSCQITGADVQYGVQYFKGLGPAPVPCSDFPPDGR